jgi:hypothetical protein
MGESKKVFCLPTKSNDLLSSKQNRSKDYMKHHLSLLRSKELMTGRVAAYDLAGDNTTYLDVSQRGSEIEEEDDDTDSPMSAMSSVHK